eukprot:2224273-Pleurochrysis_carterae.AAC.3
MEGRPWLARSDMTTSWQNSIGRTSPVGPVLDRGTYSYQGQNPQPSATHPAFREKNGANYNSRTYGVVDLKERVRAILNASLHGSTIGP